MRDVPGIASARGVFDIFIPGAFLLLHVIAVLALCFPSDPDVQRSFAALRSNSLLAVTSFVCFGYLMGVLLRLLKTETADRFSGYFCELLTRRKWPDGRQYLREDFPYHAYLGFVASQRLPVAAAEFFESVWRPRATPRGNRQFFNHSKVLVNAIDERSGAELAAAEAMTRYVSSMFYALSVAIMLVVIMLWVSRSNVLLGVLAAYLLAVVIILRNLRLLRFKEAEALFSATFFNSKVIAGGPHIDVSN